MKCGVMFKGIWVAGSSGWVTLRTLHVVGEVKCATRPLKTAQTMGMTPRKQWIVPDDVAAARIWPRALHPRLFTC
jgi:hypothetical protein